MHRCLLRPVAMAVLVSMFAVVAPGRAQDGVTAEANTTRLAGERYIVYLDFDDPELAKDVLGAAEAAWKQVRRFLAMDEGEAPVPLLPIHVYATREAYESVDRELTNGAFAKNLLFAHFATRAVHGVLVPDGAPSAREAFGTGHHFLRQIAHEAAHTAVYASVDNFRSHPDWLSEGIATCMAERVSTLAGWTTTPEATPFHATRMASCQQLRARGLLPGPRAILQDNLGHLKLNERYAIWWTFFRFLDQRYSRDLVSIVRSARSLGGGTGYTQRLFNVIRATWDDESLDRISDAYRKYVDALRPTWNEQYRSLDVVSGGFRQLAYASSNAVAWRTQPIDDVFEVEGVLEIVSSSSPQANVYVGEGAQGFFSIAFRLGAGVTLLQFDTQGSTWTNLQHADLELSPKIPFAFRVSVHEDVVRVRVNDKDVMRVKAPRRLAGRWGLGVQAGGGARWTKLRIRD